MKDLFTSIVLLAMIGIWQIMKVFQEIIHLFSRILTHKPNGRTGSLKPAPERKP